jgi:hypothetical protein
MLISKMQTCVSDKMLPPKKLKFNNHFQILLTPIFSFFIFYFLGRHFVTIVNYHFFNQRKILYFLTHYLTYCKGKNHLSESLFQIFLHQYRKKIETPENKESAFLKQSYISLANPKLHKEFKNVVKITVAFTVQSSNVSTVIFMTNHSSVHQVCQISEQRNDCVYPCPPHAEETPQVRACRPG